MEKHEHLKIAKLNNGYYEGAFADPDWCKKYSISDKTTYEAMESFASQETASLKAENEELKAWSDKQNTFIEKLSKESSEEITALKSEVDRLREGLKLIHDTAKYSYTRSEIVQSMEDIQTLSFKFLNSQQPKP